MKTLLYKYMPMDEAISSDGTNGGGTPPVPPPADGGEAISSDGTNGGATPGEATPSDGTNGGEAKPYLPDGTPPADGGEAKPPVPPPASEEDYTKALTKDEQLLGGDKDITLDEGLLKAVVPVMQKYGISPEAANALANSLAKAQIDQAKEAMQGRVSFFQKMKEESMRKYTPRDFEQISGAIDRYFKPGGVMNNVIRNSELGADPEFLALMHELGARSKNDGAAGAAAGGGSGAIAPGSIEGLAGQW